MIQRIGNKQTPEDDNDVTTDTDEKIERPAFVTIAAALLGLAAGALLFEWLLMSEVVISNGAQVFFIMLWAYLAFAAIRGHGWVRGAIVAILIVTVWGFINADSFAAGLASTSTAALAGKALALVALVLMLLPGATGWFRSQRLALGLIDVADAAGSTLNLGKDD